MEVHTQSVTNDPKRQPTSYTAHSARDDNNGVYSHWQTAWGTKPADADDYFYVIWQIDMTRRTYMSQPYDITLGVTDLEVTPYKQFISNQYRDPLTDENGSNKVYPAELVGVTYGSANTFMLVHEVEPEKYACNYAPAFHWENARDYLKARNYAGIASGNWQERLTFQAISDRNAILPRAEEFAQYLNANAYNGNCYASHGLLMRYPKQMLEDAAQAWGAEQLSGEGIKLSPPTFTWQETPRDDGPARSGTFKGSQPVTVYRNQGGGTPTFSKYMSYNLDADFRPVVGGQNALLSGSYVGKDMLFTSYAKPLRMPDWDDETQTYSFSSPWTTIISDSAEQMYLHSRLKGSMISDALANYEETYNGKIAPPMQLHEGDVYFVNVTVTAPSDYDGSFSGTGQQGSWTQEAAPSSDYARRAKHPYEIWIRYEDQTDFEHYFDFWFTADSKLARYDLKWPDGTVISSNINGGTRQTLPDKVVAVKVIHDSEFFAWRANIYLGTHLMPTQHVQDRIRLDMVNSQNPDMDTFNGTYFTDFGEYEVRQKDCETYYRNERQSLGTGIQNRTKRIDPLDYKTTLEKNVKGNVVDDPSTGTQNREIWLSLTNTVGPALADEVMAPFLLSDGIFYDLLPGGTEVDPATVRMYTAAYNSVGDGAKTQIPSSAYSVSFEYDWQGTGLTMMKVEFHLPENQRLWSAVKYDTYHRILVRYVMSNTYANIRDRGVSVLNSCAFLNTSPTTKIKVTDANNKITSLKFASRYQELYQQHPDDMVFTQKTVPFKTVGVQQTGYTKRVRAESSSQYDLKNRGLLGDNYKYWISYTISGQTTADHIVFYDELESGEDSAWKGVLTGVDIGAIIGKVSYAGPEPEEDTERYLRPVVYYSTQSNPVRDIRDASVWTATRPADLSTVKAIAVDCTYNSDGTEFKLSPDSTLNFYINMKAPTDRGLLNKKTVNESVASSRTYAGITPPESDTREEVTANCELTLVDSSFEIHKYQGDSNNENGLANQNDRSTEDPWRVEPYNRSTFNYRIVFRNLDTELKYSRVVLEDDLPSGMTLLPATSRAYVYTLSGSTRTYKVNGIALNAINDYFDLEVTKNADGTDHVRITAYSMEPDVYYDFRLNIRVGFTFTGETYKNTAKITSVNGVETNCRSNEVAMESVQRYSVSYNYLIKDAENKDIPYPAQYTAPVNTGTGADQLMTYDQAYTLDAVEAQVNYKLIDGVQVPGQWKFLGWYRSQGDAQAAYKLGERTDRALSVSRISDFFDLPEEFTGCYYANARPAGFADDAGCITAVQQQDDGSRTALYSWTNNKVTSPLLRYADLKVYGAYVFQATRYRIDYVVTPDALWGTPEGSGTPDPHTDLAYLSDTTLVAPLTTTVKYAYKGEERVPGIWEFTGWKTKDGGDITEVKGIKEAQTVYGQWKFTPDVYTLTYATVGDPNYGGAKPGDEGIPGVVNDIAWNTDQTLAGGLSSAYITFDGTPDAEAGSWRFDGWYTEEACTNKATEVNIKANTTVYGKWTFLPNGSLTIAKTVAGNAGETDREFTFTIELSDKTISKTFGDVAFTEGRATIKLKDGGSKLIEDLPSGTGYTVTEADYTADGYITQKTGDTGTIRKGTPAEARFVNTRDTYGDLTVTKCVDGNACDKTKEFAFTVTLGNNGINGTFGGMTFKDGVAAFTLKDGERVTAEDLPNGVAYTVTENADGYTETKTGDTGTIVGNETKTAAFTNTLNTYGNLTVFKTVSGNAASTTKEFDFTVTLSDNSVSGTYGDMTFADGIAKLTLKHGESKTAKDLPNGVSYKVVESNYTGYTVTKTGDTGTIRKDTPAEARFVNTRDTYGDLTVTKCVDGNACDKTKEFAFTVTLGNNGINGTFGGMTFKDGVAAFTLKDGERVTAEDLPNGVAYTVTENADGYTETKTGDTGTIVGNETKTAAFTNTLNTYGNLTVFKTVSGNAASTTKEFDFTVTLSDNSVSGTYGDMTFADGIAKLTLKHGESKTAKDLPNGVSYKVVESNYTGYTVTKTGDTGTIEGGKTAVVNFVNTRNDYGLGVIPKTGDSSNLMGWILLVLAAAVVMVVTIVTGKRRKYNGKYSK